MRIEQLEYVAAVTRLGSLLRAITLRPLADDATDVLLVLQSRLCRPVPRAVRALRELFVRNARADSAPS
ncbi:hypothetical protein ACFY5C_01945 [Streptomyces sp. NPDC012935]|uniref:hypothetical protein n=1 Tax=Streptomyces sp. NPDC012935 TaxID=3364857 RepID=UPI0036B43EC5